MDAKICLRKGINDISLSINREIESPFVTVLMPVYNGEKYIKEALNSILCQSFANFELLIIEDHSTDKSYEIISSYNDERIRIIQEPEKIGLIRSLNLGISLAKGKYIIRMDADDISLPHRFEVLIRYLEKNQQINICGSWAETIESKPRILKPDSSVDRIRCQLFFSNIVIHPSVIMRKSFLDVHSLQYNDTCIHAEDYDLWVRCSDYSPIAIIPEVLLRYRISESQVSQRNAIIQERTAMKIRMGYLKNMGIEVTPDEFDLHAFFINVVCFQRESVFRDIRMKNDPISPERISNWIIKIIRANKTSGLFDPKIFDRLLFFYLIVGCIKNPKKKHYNYQIRVIGRLIFYELKKVIKNKYFQ